MDREIELERVPDEVNDILSGFQRLSLINQLTDKIVYLERWINKRCGNCEKWMNRNCPKERNVNGYNRGPSCDDYGCELFILKGIQIEYYNKECQDILSNKYIQFIPKNLVPKLIEIK